MPNKIARANVGNSDVSQGRTRAHSFTTLLIVDQDGHGTLYLSFN